MNDERDLIILIIQLRSPSNQQELLCDCCILSPAGVGFNLPPSVIHGLLQLYQIFRCCSGLAHFDKFRPCYCVQHHSSLLQFWPTDQALLMENIATAWCCHRHASQTRFAWGSFFHLIQLLNLLPRVWKVFVDSSGQTPNLLFCCFLFFLLFPLNPALGNLQLKVVLSVVERCSSSTVAVGIVIASLMNTQLSASVSFCDMPFLNKLVVASLLFIYTTRFCTW